MGLHSRAFGAQELRYHFSATTSTCMVLVIVAIYIQKVFYWIRYYCAVVSGQEKYQVQLPEASKFCAWARENGSLVVRWASEI